jgi:A/G-specific adenine glycosylase
MPWLPAPEFLAPLAPWFDRSRRDLPWRAADLDAPHPDPYAVLVSELMLQQTQVATVIPYFTRWMEHFPTPAALAAAEEDAVHKAWEGLGYYRRARFLKAAAGALAMTGWPTGLEGLAELPGLGPYTAAAVGAIAFQWPTPALDGNAFRVLARLLALDGDPKARAADLRAWLAPALAAQGASRMTQALMELGATVCTPQPACDRCPLGGRCGARIGGRVAEIPPATRRAKVRSVDLWLLAVEAEDHFLLHPPAVRGLLAGLWRWPSLEIATQAAAGQPVPGLRAWPGWTQVYTHRREGVLPLHIRLEAGFQEALGLRWMPRAGLAALPMGKRDQRLRDLLETPGEAPLAAPDPQALVARLKVGGGLSA